MWVVPAVAGAVVLMREREHMECDAGLGVCMCSALLKTEGRVVVLVGRWLLGCLELAQLGSTYVCKGGILLVVVEGCAGWFVAYRVC
jgi:hypothetical protein